MFATSAIIVFGTIVLQGSGKTLAFGIPLIHYILERKKYLEEEESQPVSETGLEEISDDLVDSGDNASDDGVDNEDSLGEIGDDDYDEEGEEEEDSTSDIEKDTISEVDIDNADVEDDGSGGHGSSSEDEQLEQLEVG